MTESVSDLFVKFAELKLTTVDRCSLANCTNDFLIGTVHRTAPIIIDNYNRFMAGKGDLTQMSAEQLVLFPTRCYRQKSLICTSTASRRSRKAVADPGVSRHLPFCLGALFGKEHILKTCHYGS